MTSPIDRHLKRNKSPKVSVKSILFIKKKLRTLLVIKLCNYMFSYTYRIPYYISHRVLKFKTLNGTKDVNMKKGM